jgi:nucleoporin NUP2
VPHDVEGEGEEDEETTYSARIKAYRMKKEDERGGKGWVELGVGEFNLCQEDRQKLKHMVGNLRLKKHKETDARRMLLRNSSTGKINIVRSCKSYAIHCSYTFLRISNCTLV